MGESLTNPPLGADCLMLDVGHGSSSVVLLPMAEGLRRGIVVDCGRRSVVPLAVLRRYVDFIDLLLVSHNDKDHWGGAPDIISHYKKAIGRIVFLQDRPIDRNRLYKFIKDQWDAGSLLYPADAGRA